MYETGAEPRSDWNACGIRCGEALDHAIEYDSTVMGKGMDRGCDSMLGEQKQDTCWHGGYFIERAHAISVSAFRNVEEYGTRRQFPRMDVAELSSGHLPHWRRRNFSKIDFRAPVWPRLLPKMSGEFRGLEFEFLGICPPQFFEVEDFPFQGGQFTKVRKGHEAPIRLESHEAE